MVPTFAYWRPITDLTLACSASSHPIDFSAGETTVVVKTTPPSHVPAKMMCSVCAIASSMSSLPNADFHYDEQRGYECLFFFSRFRTAGP